MKLLRAISALGAILAFACALQARATVITFDVNPGAIGGQPAGSSHCLNYTTSGVTFSAVDGNGIYAAFPAPNGTFGLLSCSFSNYSPLRADFAAAFTGTVSVDLGDAGFDRDLDYLRLYDASNHLLAEATAQETASVFNFTLSAFGTNIRYAIFGSVGGGGSSVFADNFTFVPGALPPPDPGPGPASGSVALPGTGSLFALAALLAALCSRRRRA